MEKREVDVCWELGLVNSVIQTIFKKRTKIISAFEQSESRIMWFQKPGLSERGGTAKRSYNVPLSGPLFTIIFVLPKFYF